MQHWLESCYTKWHFNFWSDLGRIFCAQLLLGNFLKYFLAVSKRFVDMCQSDFIV